MPPSIVLFLLLDTEKAVSLILHLLLLLMFLCPLPLSLHHLLILALLLLLWMEVDVLAHLKSRTPLLFGAGVFLPRHKDLMAVLVTLVDWLSLGCGKGPGWGLVGELFMGWGGGGGARGGRGRGMGGAVDFQMATCSHLWSPHKVIIISSRS
jgi:hypothetical protein